MHAVIMHKENHFQQEGGLGRFGTTIPGAALPGAGKDRSLFGYHHSPSPLLASCKRKSFNLIEHGQDNDAAPGRVGSMWQVCTFQH